MFKEYKSYVHNKMEEVKLKAKAWKCCAPFTNKTGQYKNEITNTNKYKASKNKILLKHDKKEYSKQWQRSNRLFLQ